MSQPLLSMAEIQEIEKKANGSFYFMDLNLVKQNYNELLSAFRDYYPSTNLAYSFKTNYAPKICELIRDLDGWAEVVSELEYSMAVRIGFAPEKIIVNGPMHSKAFIERSLLDGAQVNLDSWYLLDAVSETCHKFPLKKFEVGIRLTFSLEEAGFSRFGIETTSENMARLKNWEKSIENCKIIGFHSHFSNSSRSLATFSQRINEMVKNSNTHFGEEVPKFINVGGGFLGKMPASLADQLPGNAPNYKEYAKAIAGYLNNCYSGEYLPTLFIEPGTAVVANTMDFICKVHEVKQVDGKYYAMVDGSNHNINHKWEFFHPF